MKPILVPLMLAGAFVGNGWLERSGDTPIQPPPEPVVEDHVTHEEYRPDRRPARSSYDDQQEARRRAAAAWLIMAMAQQNQQDRYQAQRQQQLQERLRYEAALQQRWNRMQGQSQARANANQAYADWSRSFHAETDRIHRENRREADAFFDRARRQPSQSVHAQWRPRQQQSYPSTADEEWVTASPNSSGGYTYTGRDGSVTHSFGNLSGGETFTDSSYTRPNIHGGIDVVQADGSVVTGMPNLSGGQTFTNGLSTSSNVFGGIDYMFGGRTIKQAMPTLGGGWQSQ